MSEPIFTQVERNVAELEPNAINPRTLKDKAFKELQQSLKKDPHFLKARPIIVSMAEGREGTVIAGNQRLAAAKALGWATVPVVEVRGASVEQEKEWMVKDNLHKGEWDFDKLAEGFDLDFLKDMGFDEKELNKVLANVDNSADDEFDAEKEAEAITDPIVKRGDIWQLGEHRVMCGDSTDAGDVALLMDGKKAVLLHADPPYGMGKEKDGVQNDNLYGEKLDAFQMAWWKAFRLSLENNASVYIWGNAPELWRLWYKGGLADSERLTFRNQIVWDKKSGQGMNSADRRMYPTATEHAFFFMLGEQGFNNNADNYWEGWEPIRAYLESEMNKVGGVKQWKNALGNQMGAHYFTRSQWVFPTKEAYSKLQAFARSVASDRDYEGFKRDYEGFKQDYDDLKQEYDAIKQEFYSTRAYFDNTYDNMTDVWEFPRVTGEERHGHATPKPVIMVERAVKSSAPIGALVVEPFLGSGSTLIACENTGRICYGMEIDPKYCDVIIKRWEEKTGKKAVKTQV